MNPETRTMHANWTPTAAALPGEGSIVEFLLDARDCPLRGIYTLGHFESRWTNYPPTTVRQWRATAGADCLHDPAEGGIVFTRVPA
jgi:hypothetical protein